jgi:hypothetical protein
MGKVGDVSVDFSLSDGLASLLENRPDRLDAVADARWDRHIAPSDRCMRDPDLRVPARGGGDRATIAIAARLDEARAAMAALRQRLSPSHTGS